MPLWLNEFLVCLSLFQLYIHHQFDHSWLTFFVWVVVDISRENCNTFLLKIEAFYRQKLDETTTWKMKYLHPSTLIFPKIVWLNRKSRNAWENSWKVYGNLESFLIENKKYLNTMADTFCGFQAGQKNYLVTRNSTVYWMKWTIFK